MPVPLARVAQCGRLVVACGFALLELGLASLLTAVIGREIVLGGSRHNDPLVVILVSLALRDLGYHLTTTGIAAGAAATTPRAYLVGTSFKLAAVAPRSYQPRVALTILTTDSITGTSTSTPTTVAKAAPE